jgi:hypothetical protein
VFFSVDKTEKFVTILATMKQRKEELARNIEKAKKSKHKGKLLHQALNHTDNGLIICTYLLHLTI